MAKDKSKPEEVDDVFSEKIWKRPNPKDKGDATQDLVYMSVELALSMWETLEGHFASLFAFFLGNPPNGANRVYGSIATSHGRREALRHAAEVYFETRHVPEAERIFFNKMIKSFGEASKRRDDIAHGIAYGMTINNVEYGVFLFPPTYNSDRTFAQMGQMITVNAASLMLEKFRYTSRDIQEIAGRFGAFGMRVLQYITELYALQQPHVQR